MPTLEMVSGPEAVAVLAQAAGSSSKAVVTLRDGNRWLVASARLVGLDANRLCAIVPKEIEGRDAVATLTEQEVGVSFRTSNHRHFLAGKVVQAQPRVSHGLDGVELWIRVPAEMHRLSRRSCPRIDMPLQPTVRATIWPGGRDVGHGETRPDRPAWSGSITNLSLGGYQIRAHGGCLAYFEPGDLVGVEIHLPDGEPLRMDAEFRYGSSDGVMSLLGFRFDTSLDTPELRAAFIRIQEYLLKLTGCT